MNRRMLAGWSLVAVLCAGPASAAEDEVFSLSGSVRVRHEILDGQFRPGFDQHDDQFNVRTTLLAAWRRGDWRLVGELFDSRAYDNDDGGVLSANEVNSFEPVQAYIQRDWRAPFGDGSSAMLQAGRFTMNLGSRRLVASDDYRNTPQGYTGVRVELRTAGKTQWNLFHVLPHQRRPDDAASLRDNEWEFDHEGTDLQLWGVVAAKPDLLPGGMMGEAAYIGLRERDNGARVTRDRRLHSFSLRALREPAAASLDFELEGIFQTGDISASTAVDAPELEVRAWFVHAEAGYTANGSWKAHLSLEYDHASGDGPGAGYQRFDTLFGMRRADLAPSGIFGAVGRTNLQALGLRVEVTPSARLDAFAAWRLLRAADATDSFSTSGVRDASGAAGRDAGQLLDARLRYWLLPRRLRAELNAVWLIRGRMLRDAPNATPWGDTAYGSAALTYTF